MCRYLDCLGLDYWMKCSDWTAAAALSLPPATIGNPAGSPTRAAISDFSLPSRGLNHGGNKGLILRALRISVSIAVKPDSNTPHRRQQTALSLVR